MLKKLHSVGKVEIKSETTTPGERGRRRSVTKSDFVVGESGAVIKGPNFTNCFSRQHDMFDSSEEYFTTPTAAAPVTEVSNGPTDFYVGDSRATQLSVKCRNNTFYTGPSLERFSGHTGVCRVLGNKRLSPVPHSLQLGDLIRIGSVGLVVCEVNRGKTDDTAQSLSDEELQQLKLQYLSTQLALSCHLASTTPSAEEEHQNNSSAADTSEDEDEATDDTTEEMFIKTTTRQCYICYDDDQDEITNPLVAPCQCKGDTKYVHLNCLQRWNNNEADSDGTQAKVCAVTNTEGLDVCSICKATYQTSVLLDDGRVISLLAPKLEPPYVTFCVVTQHETRSRSMALTNTRFQLSFASLLENKSNDLISIGRATSNNMILKYRTVSQRHADLKFHQGQFYLIDQQSSNGTMLYLKDPLELPWGKPIHIKIGRTILSMKAKKRWRWGGNHQQQQQVPTAAAE